MSPNEKVLYTTKDVCYLLSCSRMHLWHLVHDGQIKPIKLGRRAVRFTPAEILRFVAARQEQAQ